MRRSAEQGSISLFVVVTAVALIVAVGLVVDGGGKVRALERADEGAREAARAGTQAIEIPAAVRGTGVVVDPVRAVRAARTYLAAAGIEGTVSVSRATVTVRTTVTYRPVFLGLVGVGPLAVTGEAVARPVMGSDEEVP